MTQSVKLGRIYIGARRRTTDDTWRRHCACDKNYNEAILALIIAQQPNSTNFVVHQLTDSLYRRRRYDAQCAIIFW